MILTKRLAEAHPNTGSTHDVVVRLRSDRSAQWLMRRATEWCDENGLVVDSIAWARRSDGADTWMLKLRWEDGRPVDRAEADWIAVAVQHGLEALEQKHRPVRGYRENQQATDPGATDSRLEAPLNGAQTLASVGKRLAARFGRRTKRGRPDVVGAPS